MFDVNVKVTTLKLLEDNIGKSICDMTGPVSPNGNKNQLAYGDQPLWLTWDCTPFSVDISCLGNPLVPDVLEWLIPLTNQ